VSFMRVGSGTCCLPGAEGTAQHGQTCSVYLLLKGLSAVSVRDYLGFDAWVFKEFITVENDH
jgi:hypothetical protein